MLKINRSGFVDYGSLDSCKSKEVRARDKIRKANAKQLNHYRQLLNQEYGMSYDDIFKMSLDQMIEFVEKHQK